MPCPSPSSARRPLYLAALRPAALRSAAPGPAALALILALLAGCGGSVPAWSPDETTAGEETPTLEIEALAARLLEDPTLRVEPITLDMAEPGAQPIDAGAWLVRLPAAADGAPADTSDPEILYRRLIDLGVERVQIELLRPAETPADPRFAGDGDPGLIRVRLRRAPGEAP